MKTVIIVSKCLRVTKINKNENSYEFHFKGVCCGEYLQKLLLDGVGIKKGEEYVLYVTMISFSKGILRGSIVKAKLLSECWDKS